MCQDRGQTEDVVLTNLGPIGSHSEDLLQLDTIDQLYPKERIQREWLVHLPE